MVEIYLLQTTYYILRSILTIVEIKVSFSGEFQSL